MNISFQVYEAEPESFSGDVLVVIVQQEQGLDQGLVSPVLSRAITYVQECGDFSAKKDQALWLYPALLDWQGEEPYRAKRILLIGLAIEDATSHNDQREKLRLCGGTVAAQLRRTGAEEVLVLWPRDLLLADAETVGQLVQGFALGSYSFEGYKREQSDADSASGQKRFYFHGGDVPLKELRKGIKQAQIGAQAVYSARNMGNQPANRWTPADFAGYAEKLGKKKKLKATIFGKAEMQELGMEAILAVNRGSALPPSLSVIEYHTAKKHPTVLLVGKGLTFDSGGISAKPAAGMEDMKFDMCGGAAVMAVMQALAELALGGINVVGMVPATENLSGSAAVKPGDVVRHYGGLHAEVVNTDAEGRLILGDAIAYGIAAYAPDVVIDIATLTGAAVVGLGHHYTCLLANDDQLVQRLIQAGEESGEPLWRLPLGPEYRKQLDSTVADIKNAGDRSGATITAACYLQEFVGATPWAHLDIAGTAWNFTEKSYVPKGASGTGVRTLLCALANWNKIKHG